MRKDTKSTNASVRNETFHIIFLVTSEDWIHSFLFFFFLMTSKNEDKSKQEEIASTFGHDCDFLIFNRTLTTGVIKRSSIYPSFASSLSRSLFLFLRHCRFVRPQWAFKPMRHTRLIFATRRDTQAFAILWWFRWIENNVYIHHEK